MKKANSMMMRIVTGAALALIPALGQAQDIHFSQLSQTPLLLNPANAGLAHEVCAIINYKDQWRSVTTNPFKTFNVSADAALFSKPSGSRMGLGLNFFSDKAGDANMATTTAQLHLSGVIPLNEDHLLSAGAYGGFGQSSLDYGQLYWDNQYIGGSLDVNAPSFEPAAVPNHNFLDIGAGLAWFYGTGHKTITSNDGRNVTAGFSVQHLNRPVYTFYGDNSQRLPLKMVAHGMGAIGLKNYSLVLEPGYIVFLQGGHREINAGMLVKYLVQEASHFTGRKKTSSIVVGGYYRFSDALNIVAGYEYHDFRIGFSYDVNLSSLTSASNSRGGMEVSLRWLVTEPFGRSKQEKFFN